MAMLPGETIDATVRFPDDFPDEAQRGQTRGLRITLHEVKRQALPALDDAFAREVGDFESLEALRRAVREDLEREAERDADARVRAELIDADRRGQQRDRRRGHWSSGRSRPTRRRTRCREEKFADVRRGVPAGGRAAGAARPGARLRGGAAEAARHARPRWTQRVAASSPAGAACRPAELYASLAEGQAAARARARPSPRRRSSPFLLAQTTVEQRVTHEPRSIRPTSSSGPAAASARTTSSRGC